MSSRQPRAELVAVKEGRIIRVGRNNDVDLFKSGTKHINCEGKTVIPGFNDAHIHIMACVSQMLGVDCSPSSVSSITDIQDKIRHKAESVAQDTWIKANGYNEFYLSEKRHLTRHDLDQAAPYHPVRLTHRSLHACVLNSLALSLAGISIETPDIPGGLIDREPGTGEPSGLLYGMTSHINEQVIPPLSEDELRPGIRLVNRSLLSSGITSVQDASVRNGFDQWRTFLKLKQEGELAPEICMMFGRHTLSALKEHGLSFGDTDSGLRSGAVKITVDETGGRLNPSQDELNEAVLLAHRAGFQVAMHAVEEGTVEAAVTALEYCVQRSPKPDHRHRVEHCSVCTPSLLRRLRSINALVVTQPAFVYYSGERYLNEVSGTQLPWLYRTRSFLKSGLGPAASSDSPVVPCNPLIGVYAAVTRKAETGQVLSPEEAVSPAEALEMYTLRGAYASFEEPFKGRIEVGKRADLVVLSADPRGVAPDGIKDIKVERTIIGGEVAWEM